jgi:hypothetical protein
MFECATLLLLACLPLNLIGRGPGFGTACTLIAITGILVSVALTTAALSIATMPLWLRLALNLAPFVAVAAHYGALAAIVRNRRRRSQKAST